MLPIVVIGAGPAGMLAAGRAAECGVPVRLLEKNQMPGRKLLITGAGRCNITSAVDLDTFIGQFFGQGRFLYPALQTMYREELLDLLARHGIRCQVDHQGKYFPVTGQSSDVLLAMLHYGQKQGVQLMTDCAVQSIQRVQDHFEILSSQGTVLAGAVILTTGGMTYPVTGSSGDGYRLAAQLGHSIVPPRPALAPFVVKQTYIQNLAGLSLPDVEVRLVQPGKKPVAGRGDLLLTHKGVSGPVILRLSRELSGSADVHINLVPSFARPALIAAILTVFNQNGRTHIKNCLDSFLPHRLVTPLLTAAGIDPDRMAAQAGRRIAEQIAQAISDWTLTVTGTQGIHIAMVTAGGVALREINPASLESRLVPGLYFAGEVLDLDGDTGGYNLQAACSTGYLAGQSAAAALLSHLRNDR
ncbi:MAG: NAD(P)/FAD-dependent oxidoreductase [Eubacteriales bacterium]|nr:NAD(P)/FAD-dependent oxidoreductase [Eubacteriales bacterium]